MMKANIEGQREEPEPLSWVDYQAHELQQAPSLQRIFAKKDAAAMTRLLNKRQDKPMTQLALVTAWQNLLPRLPSPLAWEIVGKQRERVADWGKKAFPLSEKQIAVIVNDIVRG